MCACTIQEPVTCPGMLWTHPSEPLTSAHNLGCQQLQPCTTPHSIRQRQLQQQRVCRQCCCQPAGRLVWQQQAGRDHPTAVIVGCICAARATLSGWVCCQGLRQVPSAPLTCLRAAPMLLVIHERRAHEPAGSWRRRRRGGRAGRSTLGAGQAPGCCQHCCALPDCRKEEDESREGRRALGRRVCLKSGWPSQDQLAEPPPAAGRCKAPAADRD